jgi:HSP20 family protein
VSKIQENTGGFIMFTTAVQTPTRNPFVGTTSFDSLLDNLFYDRRSEMRLYTSQRKNDDGSYSITISTPGVSRNELDVSVEKSLLTVFYNRTEDSNSLTESFKRSWRLGPELDGDRVSATYTNGILTLSVPRRETLQTQTRRVEIN